jgi:hypothetical protein
LLALALGVLVALGVLAADVAILVVGVAAVCALGALALTAHRPLPSPSRFESLQRVPPAREPRPAELERLERAVDLGVASAEDFHVRLRPVLRGIAATLLAAHGLDLDRDSKRVRELVGEESWDLLWPERERPSDPFERGVELTRLNRLVEDLERL